MAMTLRLSDRETEELRTRAEVEGVSMQDVAKAALREYIDTHNRREAIDRALDVELPRYSDALRRLGE